MGLLLEQLGLVAPAAMKGSIPAPPAAQPPRKSDALDARLGTALDALGAVLDAINDDAIAAPLRAERDKLVDGRARADLLADAKRTVVLTVLVAAAQRQKGVADAARKHVDLVLARETARKEIEVLLGQVTALVLGGINDDSLRNKANADLAKAKASFAKADKVADPVQGAKALTALKPATLALLAGAEKAKQVTDWLGDTWRPLLARAKAATQAVATASARAVLQTEIDALDAKAIAAVAAMNLAALQSTLQPALERIEKVALAVVAAAAAADAELARLAGLVAAMGADGVGGDVDRLARLAQERKSTWPAGATSAELESAVAAYAAALKSTAVAIEAQKKSLDARRAFEKAYAAIKVQVDEAIVVLTTGDVLTALRATRLVTAKKAVDDAVAAADWVKAAAAVPPLQLVAAAVRTARDQKRAFDAAMAPLAAERARVAAAASSPGLPATPWAAYQAAFSALQAEVTRHDWVKALAAAPAYAKALKECIEALDDGKKFYAAYAPVRADHNAGEMAFNATWTLQKSNSRLAAVGAQFQHFHDLLGVAVAKPSWRDGIQLLPDLQAASRDLYAAALQDQAARAPFDAAFNALSGVATAENEVAAASPVLAKEIAAYKVQRRNVYAAEDAGNFATALAALPAFKTAVDALVAARQAQDDAKIAFDAGWSALADYAEAHQVAAAPVPAIAAVAAAFVAADKTIDAARKVPDWVAAGHALPALQAAASELVKAKAAFNGSAKPADFAEFATRLKALDARLAKAKEPADAAFVAALQTTVQGRASDIDAAVAAPDLAAAEAGLAALIADLQAIEAGKGRLAAHRARLLAMKNGDVKAALAVALSPPALAADRATAVAAEETRIVGLANGGDTAAADAALPGWAASARSWKDTQQAYAELHNGKLPSVDVLEDLARKPGGDKALDTLIANLPAGTPANVLSAALKARFGFEVKRFKSRKADETDLAGLPSPDPKQPDPELVEMYKLLSQIPSKRIKGQIKELVDFDTDTDAGVYYPNKKIYVYAGRLNDPSLNEEVFDKPGEVMPRGQEVEENCKPRPGSPKVPRANFTLLHEAAHAEDAGAKFMDTHQAGSEFGGWTKESPASIADAAAPFLQFDRGYILSILRDKHSKPPDRAPKRPEGMVEKEWERRRQAAVVWCQTIRAANGIWWKGGICQRVAINGRVYQESYDDGRWWSYEYKARGRGMTGYQFRAPGEWFAELYAAHFSDKLKPSHPAMSWLKQFKAPSA